MRGHMPRLVRLTAEPSVSVVMGVRNVAPFVLAAVRSALAQTHRNLEVISVDDGSTDSTPGVIRQIDDLRLRLVEQDHHGPTVALNRGVQLARGRYVGLLDGDDLWAPEKLARHVSFMEANPAVDLTFSLSRLIGEAGEDLGVTTRAADDSPY